MQPEEYERLAATEDRMWYFRALHAQLFAAACRRIDPAQPAKILDAGCGTGGFLSRLETWAPAWQGRGIDLEPRACTLARARTRAEIVEGSILAMPFADGTFDAIFLADVLYCIADPAAALREAARCARPGAALIMNTAAYRWLWSYHDEQVQTRHRFTRRTLVGCCTAAGLTVEQSTYLFMPMLPLVVIRRKLLPARPGASDVHLYPKWLDATLGALAALELAALAAGWRSPCGSSVFVVARKPFAA